MIILRSLVVPRNKVDVKTVAARCAKLCVLVGKKVVQKLHSDWVPSKMGAFRFAGTEGWHFFSHA